MYIICHFCDRFYSIIILTLKVIASVTISEKKILKN